MFDSWSSDEGRRFAKDFRDKSMAYILASTKEWEDILMAYQVPDTRPQWKKWLSTVYWHTVGRFKRWLHRDCDW